jgi:predicted RNase H-like HicB family nuclease
MLELKYSLIIEATKDPAFFGFYSPDLEGFSGVGHSVEDCIYQAKWGMEEHIALLKERGLPVPKYNPRPTVMIQNEQQMHPRRQARLSPAPATQRKRRVAR